MKSILGNAHLEWNENYNEGAYKGKTFDCYRDEVHNYYCKIEIFEFSNPTNLK